MKLFIDTETTGFPRNAPPDDPSQPYLVELAALLTDDAGEPVAYLESLVQPDGWTIPPETAAIHGITTARALAEGVPLVEAVSRLVTLASRADAVVAYNLTFDQKIVQTAFARSGADWTTFESLTPICAMKAAAEVLQIPAARGTGFKNPNLREAFAHFYGTDTPFPSKPHTAQADVLACASVYFALAGNKRLVTLPAGLDALPLPEPVIPEPVPPSVAPLPAPLDLSDLSDEEVALAIRESPGVWLEACGMIQDKAKELVRPLLNVFQWRMSQAYEAQLRANLPRRQICLKPRRVGGTTMGAAITYCHVRNYASNGVMIADSHTKSEDLLKMYERFAQNDSFDWQAEDAFQIRRLELGDSQIDRRSAEAPKGTRGNTLTCLHCSEVAFWPSAGAKSAEATNAALRTALAKHPETSDVQESTPNGAAGVFYTLWQDARWPDYDDYWRKWDGLMPADEGPGNGYIRVFMAWYEHWEYATPMDSPAEAERIRASLTAREKRGMQLYAWTVEQIKWRRHTIKSDLLNDERRFDEEYPEDPQSCFLSSGSPRFDADGMTRLEVLARASTPEHGMLQENGGRVTFVLTGVNEAVCTIWEHARAGCKYLIAVDPNSGKIVEGGKDRDASSVQVWRAGYVTADGQRLPPRLVARLRPPWRAEYKPTARFIKMLSKLYGNCIVIVENNVGTGMIDYLKDEDVYLYTQQRFDKITSQYLPGQVGWCTTERDRELTVGALGDAIREQDVEIGCPHLVGELRTFVRADNGKYEASSGKHDDDVMAAGIALYNLGCATLYQEQVRKRHEAPDEKRWRSI